MNAAAYFLHCPECLPAHQGRQIEEQCRAMPWGLYACGEEFRLYSTRFEHYKIGNLEDKMVLISLTTGISDWSNHTL